MTQRQYLSNGQKWQIISRLEDCQKQMNVTQDLIISLSVISRAAIRLLSTGSVDRLPG